MERQASRSLSLGAASAFKILGIVALAGGCRSEEARPVKANSAATAQAEATAQATGAAPAAPPTNPSAKVYGAPLGSAPNEKLASVLGEPDRFAGKAVQVEGHVRRACTAMGCWMELAESGDEKAPGCRVIMKDHAFFVPTDSAGASARVEGTLSVRKIEAAQVAHMEGEGAKFDHKAADGSAEELRFVASGVELWRG